MSIIKGFTSDMQADGFFIESPVQVSRKEAFLEAEHAIYSSTEKKIQRKLPRSVRDNLIDKRVAKTVVSKFKQDVLPQMKTTQQRQEAAKRLCSELAITGSAPAKQLFSELGIKPSRRTQK